MVTPKIQVVQATDIRNVRRRPRRPQHKFNIQAKPYEIAPFMIAPVLPGETMQNLLLQSRVVTDPINNRLVGWHKEYYFFYVPHLALVDWDTTGLLRSMMLDPTTNVSSLQATANSVPFFTYKGGMKFVAEALYACVREYFRDEDEAVTPLVENYPSAQIDQQQWWNSIKFETGGADDTELPGIDELEDIDVIPGMSTEYAQWEMMRDAGMTDMDYDDYIRSYGVSVPKEEEVENPEETKYRPELIRFSRNWSYPTNHIDPTDGSAASAVSWSIAERADKKRFFKYPGFIFGCTVTRPKVYLGNQKGAAVGFLNNAYSWLPAVLHGHVYSSIKEIEDSITDGPFQNQAEDYWFDCKDLFLYGDQFVNHAPDVANTQKVDLPGAGSIGGEVDIKYPTEAMVDALFVDTVGTNQYVREDGITHLNILGKLSETTPS